MNTAVFSDFKIEQLEARQLLAGEENLSVEIHEEPVVDETGVGFYFMKAGCGLTNFAASSVGSGLYFYNSPSGLNVKMLFLGGGLITSSFVGTVSLQVLMGESLMESLIETLAVQLMGTGTGFVAVNCKSSLLVVWGWMNKLRGRHVQERVYDFEFADRGGNVRAELLAANPDDVDLEADVDAGVFGGVDGQGMGDLGKEGSFSVDGAEKILSLGSMAGVGESVPMSSEVAVGGGSMMDLGASGIQMDAKSVTADAPSSSSTGASSLSEGGETSRQLSREEIAAARELHFRQLFAGQQ